MDPDTNAYTQHIERAWRDTRNNIPRFGTCKEHYIGYIAEFMFDRKFNFVSVLTHFLILCLNYIRYQNNFKIYYYT